MFTFTEPHISAMYSTIRCCACQWRSKHQSLCWSWHYHPQKSANHQILLLPVQHRAFMKSFQAFCLQLVPWPRSMIFLCFLFHPLLSFATFSSAYLSLYIPENSNLTWFALLFLFLYVMCVQSNSIFFFLSDFLLTSDRWFSIVLRSYLIGPFYIHYSS